MMQATPGQQENAPEVEAAAQHDGLECELTQIWKEIFGLEQVGRNDNFFELGGDSMRGMELMEKVAARLDSLLPMVILFQNPTPRQLARYIRNLSITGSEE